MGKLVLELLDLVKTQDEAGNVLNDTRHNHVYDAENRIVSVDGAIGYIYDAEGRRVGKTDGTVYTVRMGMSPMKKTSAPRI